MGPSILSDGQRRGYAPAACGPGRTVAGAGGSRAGTGR